LYSSAYASCALEGFRLASAHESRTVVVLRARKMAADSRAEQKAKDRGPAMR